MTAVPSSFFTETGMSIPSESDIIEGVLADFVAAFGGNLNPALATPQGQLITAIAAALGHGNDLLLKLVNEVDPAFASGRMQDAIARIYFLSRKGPLPTSVDCTCTGAAGTIIPAASLAVAADGTIYQSVGQVTISGGGTVTATFAAIDDGPIACPAGTLSTIYRAIPGWDSITNPADGIVGRATETRAEFETRRAASVSVNALGILPSIRATVLNIDDVIDAYVTENSSGSSATIGGVSVAARSLYVAVTGGTDADVARAIWRKKPPGAGYVGNTTVTVKDTSSGYDTPYPSYDVTFQRPTALPIYLAVELANNGLVPADAQAQIRTAIVAAFNGQDGGPRGRIGATLYASRFYAAVQNLGSWAQIVSILVGTTSSPTASDVVVNIDHNPTLDPANIAVTLV